MKRWHKRSICILIAGIIGVGALSIRTAIEPDRQITHSTNPIHCHYSNAEQQLTFNDCWQLCDETTDNEVFSALQSQDIHIDIRTADGKLLATYDTPILHSRNAMDLVETQYDAYILHTPSTHHESCYTVCLHCTVTLSKPFWQKPQTSTRSYMFRVEVPACAAPQEAVEEIALPPAVEPVYTGTAQQQDLATLAHELIALSQRADDAAISKFIQHAEQANTTHTDASLPWPSCWQEAEEDARNASALVQEAIIAIRNNNYHDSAELADFIAGECFSRIFGSAHRGNDNVFIGDELGTGLEDMIFIKCDNTDSLKDE